MKWNESFLIYSYIKYIYTKSPDTFKYQAFLLGVVFRRKSEDSHNTLPADCTK